MEKISHIHVDKSRPQLLVLKTLGALSGRDRCSAPRTCAGPRPKNLLGGLSSWGLCIRSGRDTTWTCLSSSVFFFNQRTVKTIERCPLCAIFKTALLNLPPLPTFPPDTGIHLFSALCFPRLCPSGQTLKCFQGWQKKQKKT